MNQENRVLFLATPGGKTHEIIQGMIRERQEAYEARLAYAKAKGAVSLFGSDSSISAIIMGKDAAIPTGWRRSSEHHRKYSIDGVAIVPDGKQHSTYKALQSELRKVPYLPDAREFSNRIGCSFIMRGCFMMFCSWEKIGDTFIVSVPKALTKEEAGESGKPGVQFHPADCTPLKMSEYWAMREDAKAAAAEAVL